MKGDDFPVVQGAGFGVFGQLIEELVDAAVQQRCVDLRPASLRALMGMTARTDTSRVPRPRAPIRLLTRDDAPAMAHVARPFSRRTQRAP